MTFDDDMMVLEFDGGTKRIYCAKNGFSWPPPETIDVCGFTLRRTRMSQLTDEDRATLTHVCRAAEYKP